jgi:hypothetical protein
MASSSVAVDSLSADERVIILKALALLRASEVRAARSSDADFKQLYDRVIQRLDALQAKFR